MRCSCPKTASRGLRLSESASDSLQVSSFRLRLADIADVDLKHLHTLSIGVGWPHRAEDWQFLREVGKGVVAIDDIGRVLGSAMWFAYDTDFATVGMVITSPRLQAKGAGQWLMGHVRSRLDDRDLGLNATHAARRLYLSMNFKPEAIVYQCQGEAQDPPAFLSASDIVLRPIGPEELDTIADLDEIAFGANRRPLLEKLLSQSRSIALLRDGRIAAFSLCRPFGRGHVIGPVVAETDDDAIAVIRGHIIEHKGAFLRLDTREKKGPFFRFLDDCGLSVFDTVTSMSLGRKRPAVAQGASTKIYGLASHTLG
ncbi:GNAT family N-acetyltransferase (plasmid) [Rhizobium sp. TH2]|uniref:GNAT family N-acetyltransferase n=1 Tax=Rhizobium sp. TH2 TaxID=2775403 RepID=UPI0021583C97|nr:GNAT family N-acetyltransferase [Rhizobium sp. TH2]UVC12265.1 GNAT family N-acetyltransferase [Rhizobium sp. TH2]